MRLRNLSVQMSLTKHRWRFIDKTEVVMCTSEYRIRGKISLVPGARLTDFIVDANQFIAVTDVEVRDIQGKLLPDHAIFRCQSRAACVYPPGGTRSNKPYGRLVRASPDGDLLSRKKLSCYRCIAYIKICVLREVE